MPRRTRVKPILVAETPLWSWRRRPVVVASIAVAWFVLAAEVAEGLEEMLVLKIWE